MPKENPRSYREVRDGELERLDTAQRKLFEYIVEGIREGEGSPASKNLAKKMSQEFGTDFTRSDINKIRKSVAEVLEISAGF